MGMRRRTLSTKQQSPGSTTPVKKGFLYALVASIALGALIAIIAILSGEFSWFEIRILISTAAIAAASVCGLACGAFLASASNRGLPRVGIGLAISGAAMVILGAWTEVEDEMFWKATTSFCVFAVAVAHICLLSMARLDAGFQWSLVVAYAVILGVAVIITIMVLFEIGESGMFRLLAVAAVLDAGITIVIPVFHRLSRAHVIATTTHPKHTQSIAAEIARLEQRIADLKEIKRRS